MGGFDKNYGNGNPILGLIADLSSDIVNNKWNLYADLKVNITGSKKTGSVTLEHANIGLDSPIRTSFDLERFVPEYGEIEKAETRVIISWAD